MDLSANDFNATPEETRLRSLLEAKEKELSDAQFALRSLQNRFRVRNTDDLADLIKSAIRDEYGDPFDLTVEFNENYHNELSIDLTGLVVRNGVFERPVVEWEVEWTITISGTTTVEAQSKDDAHDVWETEHAPAWGEISYFGDLEGEIRDTQVTKIERSL